MIVFLQARTSSKRLPNKVLKIINNKPMFLNIIDSLKKSKYIKKIILTTSTNKSDDKLVSICKKNRIEYFRGDLENVSKRLRDLLIKLMILLIRCLVVKLQVWNGIGHICLLVRCIKKYESL